jgi:hypothetical protein
MDDSLKMFMKISKHRMCDHYLPKLVNTLQNINNEELWLQELEGQNSIGGIALHIAEHVKRNTLYYSECLQFNQGIEECFPNKNCSTKELITLIQDIFTSWKTEVDKHIEKNEALDMFRLYHLVEHTSYHLGQIVDRAKRYTGKQFRFCQNGINEKSLKDIIENT